MIDCTMGRCGPLLSIGLGATREVHRFLNSESSPQLRFLVGDYTVFDDRPCACGRTHVRAIGSFVGRADDIINLRGIKLYPSQIEEGVRVVPGIGDEYEIVLATQPDGLDTMTLRVEHAERTS